MMNWILSHELSWTIALFVFSLVSIVSIGYFKFTGNLDRAQFLEYFGSSADLVRRLGTRLRKKSAQLRKLSLISSQNKLYSTFKMTSERKQSFIRHSLDERNRKQNQQNSQHDSFIYSSIFSFTKTLINRAPKTTAIKQIDNKNQLKPSPNQIVNEERQTDNKNLSQNLDNSLTVKNKRLPIHNTVSTLSNLDTMSKVDENEQCAPRTMCKSVSLQIKDEMKAPRNRLLHQSSSGSSSHSSTPNDLFSMAEKGKMGASLNHFRKHKPLLNHKVHQQATYTELVTQIENHEDAINREYLLHQLNPNQYHSMHYYRRLERQNCINKDDKKLIKQDTNQSNSSTNQNNSNELEHFTNSSSNSSCSECDSLDTEEELTIPFMKKTAPYQSSLRSKHPLKLSSSIDKNFSNFIHLNNLTKQCSSDSNEPMVGLLNENLIKRQLSNGTYLKLSDRINDNKLSDKRKRILGRRLTAQNNSFSGSSFNNSFNNSSNNSSFDHDDMLVQFTSHQANSFSSSDNQQFHHFNHYDNNSNDTSSSSNSSCGHRHAERTKSLNLNNEFNMLNVCDNQNYLSSFEQQQDEYLFSSESTVTNCLHVTHAYEPTTRKLKIRIVKLDYVPMKITDCDRYYIKLIILPNKRQKFKTTIKTCTSNQIDFDELFIFNRISPETIMNLSIKYLLYSVNIESKHRNIGEAIIRFETRKPMQQEDNLIVYLNSLVLNRSLTNQSLSYSNTMKNSASSTSKSVTNTANNELSDSSSIHSDSVESHHSIQLNLPELLIGLAYNATTGRLQVSIIRGSQFKSKPSKPPDTFVKCILMSSAGREMGRNKTTVKKSQPNPVFKQTFAFQVALFQLPDVSLMISVYNKKAMSRKEMIGWFSLGCNSSGEEENSHWNEMRDSKGEQILTGGVYMTSGELCTKSISSSLYQVDYSNNSNDSNDSNNINKQQSNSTSSTNLSTVPTNLCQ